MSRRKPDPTSGSWIEAVSAISGRSAEAVSAFLDRHDIREQALIPRPADITIQRVAFGGEKDGETGAVPFEFEWPDLGPGLWLIGSDRNLKGKTSLLGVMRWLLRGSRPDSIPSDVLPWIRHAKLDFLLDGVPHRASVDLRTGYLGHLVEAKSGMPELDRIQAASPEAFADAVSEFMMRSLGLYPILGIRKDGEEAQVIRHRWPALFGAFHIGTDYSALLGNVVEDGLPNRMLNMFAGFPHAPAVASIMHVLAGLKISVEREDRSRDAVSAHARVRVARLREELSTLERTGTRDPAADHLAVIRRVTGEVESEYERLPALQREAAEAADAAISARRQHNSDRLALQHFVEAGAAAAVFRALDPKCCPRCDRTFGADRRMREQQARTCMVCGDETLTTEAEDAAEVRARLERAERLSAQIRKDAQAAEDAARAAVRACQERIEDLDRQLKAARARLAEARTDEARQSRRAVLEAMIAEMEGDIAMAAAQPETDEGAIAKACEAVFKARLKAEQDEVLTDVQDEVRALLRALGIEDLAAVRLTSHPQLKLLKRKVEVNYSDLSVGEKLRCKIALVVALMKVAQTRGVGRHPGILFIDTPGAQELAEGDLQAMAAGLASLCRDLPTLQVFVATKRVAEFEAAVPPEHRLVAPLGGPVW